ncbi:MAG: hypothetical protein AAB857_02200 [Patescibacteria group bacterium]
MKPNLLTQKLAKPLRLEPRQALKILGFVAQARKSYIQQNKKKLAISVGRLSGRFAKGAGDLLGFAAEMGRRGRSNYVEQGEIRGKTKNGKEYRGVYGFHVKVGLNINSKRQTKPEFINL